VSLQEQIISSQDSRCRFSFLPINPQRLREEKTGSTNVSQKPRHNTIPSAFKEGLQILQAGLSPVLFISSLRKQDARTL
jgi:hypothetical protein